MGGESITPCANSHAFGKEANAIFEVYVSLLRLPTPSTDSVSRLGSLSLLATPYSLLPRVS